jgi:tetratricopeptide (TPR) repeat protein
MKNKRTRRLLQVFFCAVLLSAASISAQTRTQNPAGRQQRLANAPQTSVTVDGSEAMFTTMCALLAAGFEAEVSPENWSPYRLQMRERLQQQQGAAVDALREFYKEHRLRDNGATLSRYLWFGLVSGPAPGFQPVLRRDELPPEVIQLEGFSDILSSYYKEQNIGQLWRQVQPVYNRDIERLHEAISQIVFTTDGYLRQLSETNEQRTFAIIVEPLVGRITNVRNFGDHYAIVLSGSSDVPTDVIRHAYLHFSLDPLPLQYPHVIAVKRPLLEKAAIAPRLDPALKDDLPSYFAECSVRAVELKLRRMSPGERDAALDRDDADGYVLVRPLFVALKKYEESEPSMKIFYPEWIRAVDANAEVKRVASLHFAEEQPANSDDTAAEAVARRRPPQPTTVPNDSEAIAALTEGEKRIAERNPRAAEAAFQKVLTRYPDQVRAWYGIGLVALLDHDGPRAKQVFGRLTTGDHAAKDDPMVRTWSHVYLARIYGGEGQDEMARTEYEAALAVPGGPEQARAAAQRELADFAAAKSTPRP